MTQKKPRSYFLAVGLLALLTGVTEPTSAQGLPADPFATHLLGYWEGEGEYEGSRLQLTRTWTLELRDQFFRADMQVTMANEGSFGALTFWKQVGDRISDILWMDGTGRMQRLQALRVRVGGNPETHLHETVQGPALSLVSTPYNRDGP